MSKTETALEEKETASDFNPTGQMDGQTRKERHEWRLLNSHPDELGRTDFIERRALLAQRRQILVGEELSRLAPRDLRRKHRKNAKHPNARGLA